MPPRVGRKGGLLNAKEWQVCRFAASCFECPLPDCHYEQHHLKSVRRQQRTKLRLEQQTIMRKMLEQGYSIKVIAVALGLSYENVRKVARCARF
jgi:hypothetical protein